MITRKRTIAIWVVLILFIGYQLGSIDQESIDDQGLISELLTVRDADNGLTPIAYIFDPDFSLYRDRDDSQRFSNWLNGEEWNATEFDEHLARNQKILAGLRQVSTYTQFKLNIPDPISRLPNLSRLSDLSKLLILESMSLARKGDFDRAIDSINVTLKFTVLLSLDANRYLITHSVAMSMQDSVLRWVHDLAVNYPLNQAQFLSLAAAVDALPAYQDDGFEGTFAGEFQYTKEQQRQAREGLFPQPPELAADFFGQFVDSLIQEGEYNAELLKAAFGLWLNPHSSSYHFHTNRVLSAYAERLRFLAAQAGSYCHQVRYPDLMDTDASSIVDFLKPNGFARGFLGRGDSHRRLFESRCLRHAHRQSVRVIIALRRFQMREGYYPDALEGLVPADLPLIPIDPFDGRPMKYNAASQWLYSAGSNFTDNKGFEAHFYDSECQMNSECMQNPTFPIKNHPWFLLPERAEACEPTD